MEDRKGGFPHSEITGSKGARASPVLIAACHVLHRLSTPRHPLGALIRLIVLSKTHACFAVRSTQGQGDPIRKRTHQFCISQTMMSSQVQPGQHSRARLNPSIHDVKARPTEAGVQSVISIARSPRPDGRRLGGARRDRTDDLMLAKHPLYQLSYGPIRARPMSVIRQDPTSRLFQGDGRPGQTRTADLTLIRRTL